MENDTKKVVSNSTAKITDAYKPLRDLSNEDLAKLEKVKVSLIKNTYKGNTSYSWESSVGPYHIGSRKFDELAYLTILNVKKMEPTSNSMDVIAARRFIKGLAVNGKEFHQVQFIFGYRTFLTRMINDNELRLIDSYVTQGKLAPINWISKPIDVDVDEDVNITAENE